MTTDWTECFRAVPKRLATISDIRIAASQMASDDEICRMYGLGPDMLAKYRDVIDQARARAQVALKYQRMQAIAKMRKPPEIADES